MAGASWGPAPIEQATADGYRTDVTAEKWDGAGWVPQVIEWYGTTFKPSSTAKPPVDPTPTPTATPDVTMLPFAATSPWRLPIAMTATFAPESDLRNVDIRNNPPGGSVWVNSYEHAHPVDYALNSDPFVKITDTQHGEYSIPKGGDFHENIPDDARISGGSDHHMHLVTPDRTKVQEHYQAYREGGQWFCRRRHEVDLLGSGIGPQNGTRAYGGAAFAGMVRAWEVDPTDPAYDGVIRHALAIALRGDQLYYNGTWRNDDGHGGTYDGAGYGLQMGYVWPATEQDYNSNTLYSGRIPMGTYFAIPPTVDVTKLGLSAEGLMVAKAAQDYGCYVTDRSDATAFYCQDDGGGPAELFGRALRDNGGAYGCRDPRTILDNLRAVTNNSVSTPNGGALGAARRA